MVRFMTVQSLFQEYSVTGVSFIFVGFNFRGLAGLYNVTRTLTFASYFCKTTSENTVKIARRRVYISAKQNLLTKFFAKNKLVNQLIMKLACPMQHRRTYQSKILMKVLKLKFQNVCKSKFSWLIYDSSKYIMNCDFCRKAGPDI
jgi:hypothetical protein